MKYTIQERFIGYHTYEVVADTPEQAKAIYENYSEDNEQIKREEGIDYGDSFEFAFMHDEDGIECLEDEYE